MNIIILGSKGMVGSEVLKYLSFVYPKKVVGVSKKINSKKDIKNVFAKFKQIDFVINCAGVLKGNNNYKTNWTIPKLLVNESKINKFKIIQISTDDVFDRLYGPANEEDKANPKSLYGKSKLKGEFNSPQILNIRTSFLGFDKSKKKGLIEFLILNKNKKVDGYENILWSGCTTIQFAKFCKYLVSSDNFYKIRTNTSVIHFAPLGPINKYQLLKTISKILRLKVLIKRANSKTEVTRYLESIYFNNIFYQRYNTDIIKAIKELSTNNNEY